MGISEWWKKQRAQVSADAHKTITGIDPRTSAPALEEHAVLVEVASMVRQLFDAGADPIVLIQAYMTGAVWLADNVGISREQLVQLVKAIELKRDRQLIWTP